MDAARYATDVSCLFRAQSSHPLDAHAITETVFCRYEVRTTVRPTVRHAEDLLIHDVDPDAVKHCPMSTTITSLGRIRSKSTRCCSIGAR